MSGVHLAQINVERLRAPVGDPMSFETFPAPDRISETPVLDECA